MITRAAIIPLLFTCAQPVAALQLTLPGAAQPLANELSSLDSYELPLAPFDLGQLQSKSVKGQVTRQSWRIDVQDLTTLQILDPLKTQLAETGYEILFECDRLGCGGFDFRFETEVLPAPYMHVDLGDFRFLSAQNGDSDHLSILISRSASAGYVQLIRVTEAAQKNPALAVSEGHRTTTHSANPVASPAPSDFAGQLLTLGHVVLSDLKFETGSSALGVGEFASLTALAGFLKEDSSRRVALVGHTDAVGNLERNIALSKRRATSVRERLVSDYGVSRSQLAAEGMGYLSPVAPNQTSEGREVNRRVEAVLLNTE